MPRDRPIPPANVDNVLPDLIEQARRQREANAAAREGQAVPAPAQPADSGSMPPADPGLRQLRGELRSLHWVLALALAAIAALLLKVFF